MALTLTFGHAVVADEVAAFLEQHGLKQLLAVHLEQQLEAAPAAERSELVLRLANLYAELLDASADPAHRSDLEERSRRLLTLAPPRTADALRLALLRTMYRSAERIAENHRLRLVQPAELQSAIQTFADIIPQLHSLRQQSKEAVQSAERQHGRAAGAQSHASGAALDRARSLYNQCVFLNAWSLYYQAWLNDRAVNAKAAEPLFAEILGAESAHPQASEISVDLRELEVVARAILGMALCRSMSASPRSAIEWIELLEHPVTFEPLRSQAMTWKLAIYLEHGQFAPAQQIVQEQRARAAELDAKIPLVWLRLIAVHVLEHKAGARHDRTPAIAEELVSWAITELAARGELEQVMDLATRYGTQSLGDSGFAVQYVRGVIAYQEARNAHGGDEPTTDEHVRSLYASAAKQLKIASQQTDAQKYAPAAAACGRLIAWSHYFRGEFTQAADAFDSASRSLAEGSGDEAAEALWMAIVCLDRLADEQGGGSPALNKRLAALSDRFLRLFPASPRAAKLVLKKSVREAANVPSEQQIQDLLAISPGNEVYDAAQRRAADLLYTLFRQAGANDRFHAANRFLSVALPLISAGPGMRADAAEVQQFIVRCRQVLEAALSDGVDRFAAARTGLEALDDLAAANHDLAEYQDELDCRRAQERLGGNDVDAATKLADALWTRNQNSIWSRLTVRSIFKHGHRVWKESGQPQESAARNSLELVVRYGGRVLYEFRDKPAALDQPGAFGYHAAVAEASMLLWEQTDDQERGRAALFLYERLLSKRPRSAPFLRAAAILQQNLGDKNVALDLWRRILAGTDPSSAQWFEAKFNLIQTLAQVDPQRAKEVMAQHRLLNPDYGPEPWGAKLKGLDEQLQQASKGSDV